MYLAQATNCFEGIDYVAIRLRLNTNSLLGFPLRAHPMMGGYKKANDYERSNCHLPTTQSS